MDKVKALMIALGNPPVSKGSLLPRRFLFRMTDYRNLQRYLADEALYAKNHPKVQPGFRISYDEIVARRGTAMFTAPCRSNIIVIHNNNITC